MTQTDELETLRRRVNELEAELAEAPPRSRRPGAPGKRRTAWRTVVAATLIVLACLLAPLSVTAVWASSQVSDTDRYVETVAPLADDPAIQSAVATTVTEEIFRYIDIETITSDMLDAITQQGLPPRAAAGVQALQVPIVNGLQSFTSTQVRKIVASDRFAAVWEQANRTAHAELVTLLSGEQGGAVSAQNGTVTLNLAPIIERVKQQLIAEGYSVANRIPTVNRSFVLVSSDSVTKVQGLYRLLNALGSWLPAIALALLAMGVYVARGHRRALLLGSLGIVMSMLALGVALAVARPLYLDSVPTDLLPREAAGNVFDTLVRFLRDGLRATAVLALVVAFAAFFTGPSTTAERTRSAFVKGIGSLRGTADSAGLSTGPVGTWIFAHKRPLRLAMVIAGGLLLTFWSRPTVGVVVGTALAVLVGIGLIELLGRPPSRLAAAVPADGQEPPVPSQREPVSTAATLPNVTLDPLTDPAAARETTPHA
jgi:hypothetical protein